MELITRDVYIANVRKSKNFTTFEDAYNNGFFIKFKNGSGYALQVDTEEFEWLEVQRAANELKYYGSR